MFILNMAKVSNEVIICKVITVDKSLDFEHTLGVYIWRTDTLDHCKRRFSGQQRVSWWDR